MCVVCEVMSLSPSDIKDITSREYAFSSFIDGDTETGQRALKDTSAWGGCVWVQVDRSNVGPWLRRSKEEAERHDSTVVCLCPARTNTKYFHDIILHHATKIYFLRSRLKYSGHRKQAPHASLVAVFGPGHTGERAESLDSLLMRFSVS